MYIIYAYTTYIYNQKYILYRNVLCVFVCVCIYIYIYMGQSSGPPPPPMVWSPPIQKMYKCILWEVLSKKISQSNTTFSKSLIASFFHKTML